MKKRVRTPFKPFVIWGVHPVGNSPFPKVDRLAAYRTLQEAKAFALAFFGELAAEDALIGYSEIRITGRTGEVLSVFEVL